MCAIFARDGAHLCPTPSRSLSMTEPIPAGTEKRLAARCQKVTIIMSLTPFLFIPGLFR